MFRRVRRLDELSDLQAAWCPERISSIGSVRRRPARSSPRRIQEDCPCRSRRRVRLFNRTTRSVSLTDAGRNFVDHVGPAVKTLHDAMGAARSQQEIPSGTLRINAFATGAREVLGPLLLKFLRRYPRVHIDLVTEGRIVDIIAERVRSRPEERRPGAERHDCRSRRSSP